MEPLMPKYKSVWISDTHLGNPNCQHEKLYEFLKSLENEDGGYDLERIFLVGDIIDMTQIDHKTLWGKHRKVIKKLFRMADRGVQVIYIPGNHDYFVRNEMELDDNPDGVEFKNIIIRRNDTYINGKGEKVFMLHGDEFDGVIRSFPFIYAIGDYSYKVIIMLNRLQNGFRRFFGMKEWSFAQWIKHKAKRAVQFMNRYEELVSEGAERRGADIVICGHIHNAADQVFGQNDDVRYMNCGCWVEFCSYICEYEDGTMETVIYHQ